MDIVQTRAFRETLNDLPDDDASDRRTGARQEQSIRRLVRAIERWTKIAQVGVHRIQSGQADRDDAFLVALATNAEHAELGQHLFDFEIGEFSGPQSRGVHQLDQRTIAQGQGIVFDVRRVEQFLDFVATQRVGQALPRTGLSEFDRRIGGGHPRGVHEAAERPDGGHVSRDGGHGQAAIFRETANVTGDEIGGELLPSGDFLGQQMINQGLKITGVSQDGVGGEPTLNPAVGEKVPSGGIQGRRRCDDGLLRGGGRSGGPSGGRRGSCRCTRGGNLAHDDG